MAMLRTCPNMTLAVERDVKTPTLTLSLDINRHSFTDITEKFPAFLDKLNDIARQCVPVVTQHI